MEPESPVAFFISRLIFPLETASPNFLKLFSAKNVFTSFIKDLLAIAETVLFLPPLPPITFIALLSFKFSGLRPRFSISDFLSPAFRAIRQARFTALSLIFNFIYVFLIIGSDIRAAHIFLCLTVKSFVEFKIVNFI